MTAERDPNKRMGRITTLLLANRSGTEDWGEISHVEGKPCPQKVANKFLLCCLLDYQMNADVAWGNGYRLVEDILGDPDDLWRAITSVSETEWASKWGEYKLHRFPAGHNRLWRIGKVVCDKYGGDARRIWQGEASADVIEKLLELGAGEQISGMIFGALRDCGQIKGTSDLKADRYIRRVLGRAVIGKTTDAATSAELARHLHPADPWQLDWPLWNVGKSYCHANHPSCSRCYLAPHCAYARNLTTTRMIVAEVPQWRSAPEIPQVSYAEAEARFAQALSVTTYNSVHPRFLYLSSRKGNAKKPRSWRMRLGLGRVPRSANILSGD